MLALKTSKGEKKVFRRLRADFVLMKTLDKISDQISSLEGSDSISEYSLDFISETDSEVQSATIKSEAQSAKIKSRD